MSAAPHLNRSLALLAAGLVVPLLLLGAAIVFTQQQLRGELQTQIARRDATLLEGLLRQQLRESGDDSAGDPLSAVLETTRLPQLPGVRSVIVYSPEGRFVHAWPLSAMAVPLDPELRAEAAVGRPGIRFHPAARLDAEFDSFGNTSTTPQPLLEVVVVVPDPLKTGLAGFARFLLDGSGLAGEYAQLERSLWHQAILAFGITGGVMTFVLALAFRRLNRANQRLERANHELTLAAKTSAVGAVASHLIHGLKNPLAGLQLLLRDPAKTGGGPDDWSDAAAITQRMKGMIDDVARVLREDSGFVDYEIPGDEVLGVVAQRLGPAATERRQRIETETAFELKLPNRDANLTLLILENLASNAMQASPNGSSIWIRLTGGPAHANFTVTDSGSGLPESVRERLFSPVVSTKPGGTGIGLALSRQLARHMGADLHLVRTGTSGTEFALTLPLGGPTDSVGAGTFQKPPG